MCNIDNLVRENIRRLLPYSSARDEFSGKNGVFLDANENPFGTMNRYPDPYQSSLKSMLARQKGLRPNQIFVGNGSDEVIDLLYRVFCNPGIDMVLTFPPTYGMYEVSAAINDIEILKLPLNDMFQIDMEGTKKLHQEQLIKLTFICSPNNPTGHSFPRKDIELLLQCAKGIVVVDEAYIDFSESDSLIGLINTYQNLVVMQTMSKAHGMAAVRVGFAFANEQIIKLLNKVKPPYNVSSLNQQAAMNALQNDELFDRNVRIILSQRKELERQLSRINLVEKIYPSDANFLLVQFKEADKIYQALVDQKIIVRNRSKVVKNCIRITLGTPEENSQLLNQLKQFENEKSAIY